MPILIMGLIALLVFVSIVVLVCSAGVAERHEREESEAPTATPPAAPTPEQKIQKAA
ncbi:MAG TPA: hypothetical protein VLT85_07950 [Terriglobales bacterium]|nr:hypothetical protein [Terriglobales bacterium]